MSIKLFCKWFVQLQLFWFHSSLKQSSSTGTEFISCFTVKSTFFWFLTGTGSKCDQSPQEWSSLFLFRRNNNLYCYWIHYLLFCINIQYLFRFWINNSACYKKYKYRRNFLLERLISAYSISLQVRGSSGAIGNRFCDNSKLRLHLQRRIKLDWRNYHHRSLQHKR